MNLQEDYCSYEVSKLLKEKGFDCSKYPEFGWDLTCYDKDYPRNFSRSFDSKENWVECPTHQMI